MLQRSAATSPDAEDPRLRSLRLDRPFRVVWQATLASVRERPRWSVTAEDPRLGTVHVEVRPLLGSMVDELSIELSLDELGQTRLDVASKSPGTPLTPWRHTRRIVSFLRRLEQRIGSASMA